MNSMTVPNSSEAEQSLLGALLLDNSAFDKVSWLSEIAFYQERHRRLWSAITRLIEASKQADLVTVCEALGADLERAGGASYVAGLVQNTPSAQGITRYAEIVRQKAVQRTLAQVGTEIVEAALSPGVTDTRQLLDEAEAKILGVSESTTRTGQGPIEIRPLLAQVVERIDYLYHRDNPSDVTGVPTGFIELDSKTAGLQPGDLIIIAGRPSMGKTALALNIAEHVAVEQRLPVVVFSMEMSGSQLATRLCGSIARIDQHKLRTGKLADDEWSSLSRAMGRLNDAPIYIDESAALNIIEVRSRARRLWRQCGGKLGLVVVDYLQLMSAIHRNGENRATEISEISRSLKALAKELDVPVVALSQLSRAVEQRHDRHPTMSDLRESGAIEQDADVILFIYREEVYYPDNEELKGYAELIVGKQRNGPIGKIDLTFIAHLTRFENYSSLDGSPRRPRAMRPAKVSNFHDYKSAAAGDSAA